MRMGFIWWRDRFGDFIEEYGGSGIAIQDFLGIHPIGHRFSIRGDIQRLTSLGENLKGQIPIATDGSGNRIVLQLEENQLRFLDHETGEVFTIAGSCTELYDGLTCQG